jgi:hypothetical protein
MTPNMATVDGLRGVVAVGDTIEDCRQDLIEVIEDWVALGLRMGHPHPANRWPHYRRLCGADLYYRIGLFQYRGVTDSAIG